MTGKNALDSIIVLQVHEMVLNPVQTIMNSETMIPHITRSVKRFCCIYRRVKHRNCRQPIAVIQRQISAHKLCKLTDGKPGTKWPVNELQCLASLWPIQKFSFFFFFWCGDISSCVWFTILTSANVPKKKRNYWLIMF